MSCGVEHGDEATHRVAVDDRPGDADGVAEGAHVVGADFERPVVRVVPGRATVVPEVEVDQLRVCRQCREVRLEVGVVVSAGPSVQQHHGGPFGHGRAVRHEGRTVDIEPEPGPVDVHLHSDLPSSPLLPSLVRMASPAADLDKSIDEIAAQWRSERAERQARRHLDRQDFDLLRDAGLLKLAVPESAGGSWQTAASSARRVCEIYRRLASADPSVALVSTMHPTVHRVLARDLGSIAAGLGGAATGGLRQRRGRRAVGNDHVGAGERRRHRPHASDGHAASTREPFLPGRSYAVTGDKHFGSGFGITDRMITTAIPEGESDPTIFVLDVRDRPWDGSAGLTLDRRVGRHGDGGDAEPRHAARRGTGRCGWRGTGRSIRSPGPPARSSRRCSPR